MAKPATDQETTGDPELTLLARREVEAKIVGPLVRGFIAELGQDRALEVVRNVVAGLARDRGAELARAVGEASLAAFAADIDRWREGGALEIDFLARTPDRLDFNVTRCRYAEMYRALGLADLGGSLSCQRDFALVQGFNPAIALTRTQTLMEGATHCDFRFRSAKAETREQTPTADERPNQGRKIRADNNRES